jgi:hypothetical protein
MPDCTFGPTDRRAFGKAVGEDLVAHHGKKKYYSVKEIKSSTRRLNYPVDWDCWAFSLFMSAPDFNTYHKSTGEPCDLAKMKSEMTAALTDGASWAWFDIDFSWLDWPDIDLSDIFDLFDIL